MTFPLSTLVIAFFLGCIVGIGATWLAYRQELKYLRTWAGFWFANRKREPWPTEYDEGGEG